MESHSASDPGPLRRWAFLAFLLAFVLAPVLFLWGRGTPSEPTPDPETDRRGESVPSEPNGAVLQGADVPAIEPQEAVEDPELETRTDPTLPNLRGSVRSAEGRALADALVFLYRKDSDDFWQTKTDADGRFDLGRRDLGDAWVGAAFEGHLPVFRRGESLSPERAIELVLEPGPIVRVRVSDGRRGALPLDTTILVSGETELALPLDLAEALCVHRDVAVEAGTQQVSFRVGTRKPIHLRASYGNVRPVVEPRWITVEPPGEAAFTVRPSCGLDLTAFDARTGEPLDRGFGYDLLRAGEFVTSGTTTLPGGRLVMGYRLKPGVYELQAWALGYRKTPGVQVELADYGDVARVSVRLEPDPTVGYLRVSIPILAGLPRLETSDGLSTAPPGRFLWKRGEGTWEASLSGTRTRESGSEYLFAYVPEGELDLLVAEEVSDLVAFVPGIRVYGSETVTVVADLRPGVRFTASELWPADREPRAFRVLHPTHGALPLWSLTRTGAYWEEAGSVPARGLEIGPYPGPEIEVVSVFGDGEEVRSTVRVEED